mmetsp:Transcript_17364/g.32661  ORF Transcript_17364/g.32661 Transcript_17364/m.32661 type:complete len:383 (+) Transcript_17364:83-1231(+)
MYKITVVLACLICVADGRRVQSSPPAKNNEQLGGGVRSSPMSRGTEPLKVRDSKPNLRVLAEILKRHGPSAAFHPSVPHTAPHLARSASSAARAAQRPARSSPLRPTMAAPGAVTALGLPADTYFQVVAKGQTNAKMSFMKCLIFNIMGGFQVGIGGLLCLTVCGNIPGVPPGFVKFIFGALFPVCLMLVLNTGTQLFTGNAVNMVAAQLDGEGVTTLDVIKNWIICYIGNIIGCAGVAFIAAYAGLLTGGTAAFAATVGVVKAGTGAGTFGQMLVRGIMCNYLVNMAVFLAMEARDMMGRYIGIFIPVSTFVTCGFEHSVANMFLLPAAMLAGAPITLQDVCLKNMIPVTIGNAISAAVLVSMYFSYAFGKLGQPKVKKEH